MEKDEILASLRAHARRTVSEYKLLREQQESTFRLHGDLGVIPEM